MDISEGLSKRISNGGDSFGFSRYLFICQLVAA